MSILFQLVIFLCSFIQAEYVLYKYDGTELSVQEHHKAYQILLEQQWPTAPAFNTKYNPEVDEEVEIAKRLKTEVPTVYAQWIPRIVYECAVLAIIYGEEESELYRFVSREKFPDFYKQPFCDWYIADRDIIQLGAQVNLLPQYIQLHRHVNEALRFVFKDHQQSHDYYCNVITKAPCNVFEILCMFMSDAYEVMPRLIFRILKTELFLKNYPNYFRLWRAEDSLPERDFSIEQLKFLTNDLTALDSNKSVSINELHLANVSYGASFLSGFISDPGASCFTRYYGSRLSNQEEDEEENEGYLYALLLKKSDILNGTQLFAIPPVTTLIGNFFCRGELFHPRACTLMSDDLQARQDIENGLSKIMDARYKDDKKALVSLKGDKAWYDYWTRDPIVSHLVFKLNSPEEVVKQVALRRQFIVQNSTGLNRKTQTLIDGAKSFYESIRKQNPIEQIVPKSLPERVKDIFYSLNLNRYDFLAITIALILDYYSVPKKIWSIWAKQ